MHPGSADNTIASFHASIADPDVFCGGGSVAAFTAAGGAATALLVMRLDLKRRVNQADHGQIEASIVRTEALIEQLHGLAKADIDALDVLLDAQRGLKSGGDAARQRFLSALTAAAESPLEIGAASLELLEMIDDELARAGRFTISDLGAAATLIEGACRAAFLTAEVNIALVREAEGADHAHIERIDRRREQLLEQIIALAHTAEAITRQRIHRNGGSSQ
jgi:formiminotetrahydrofolate cyclodeaminase